MDEEKKKERTKKNQTKIDNRRKSDIQDTPRNTEDTSHNRHGSTTDTDPEESTNRERESDK